MHCLRYIRVPSLLEISVHLRLLLVSFLFQLFPFLRDFLLYFPSMRSLHVDRELLVRMSLATRLLYLAVAVLEVTLVTFVDPSYNLYGCSIIAISAIALAAPLLVAENWGSFFRLVSALVTAFKRAHSVWWWWLLHAC